MLQGGMSLLSRFVFLVFLVPSLWNCSGSANMGASKVPGGESIVSRSGALADLPNAMTFGWPSTGVALVKERAEKKGTEAETAYELHLCEMGGEMLVRYESFRFVSIGGISAEDERVRSGLAQAQILSKLIPKLRVGRDGRLIEFIGLKQLMAEVVQLLPESDTRAMIKKFMADPQVIAMIEAKASEVWSSWVAAWALFKPNGKPIQSFVVEAIMPAGPVKIGYQIERVERVGSMLRLRMDKSQSSEELKPILMQLLRPLLESAPNSEEAQRILSAATMTRTTSWEVLTDPSSLRPSESDTKVVTTISIPGQASKTSTETHHYDFDWTTASDTAPKCDD